MAQTFFYLFATASTTSSNNYVSSEVCRLTCKNITCNRFTCKRLTCKILTCEKPYLLEDLLVKS